MAPPTDIGSPRIGEVLLAARRAAVLSRRSAATRAGIPSRELRQYERGTAPIPDDVAEILAETYGCDVSTLLPDRDHAPVVLEAHRLRVGGATKRFRSNDPQEDEVLRSYLGLLYELRDRKPGTAIPLRDDDVDALAEALGGTADKIETRLIELMDVTREEAAAIRGALLRRRFAVPAAGFVLGAGALAGGLQMTDHQVHTSGATPTAAAEATVDVEIGAATAVTRIDVSSTTVTRGVDGPAVGGAITSASPLAASTDSLVIVDPDDASVADAAPGPAVAAPAAPAATPTPPEAGNVTPLPAAGTPAPPASVSAPDPVAPPVATTPSSPAPNGSVTGPETGSVEDSAPDADDATDDDTAPPAGADAADTSEDTSSIDESPSPETVAAPEGAQPSGLEDVTGSPPECAADEATTIERPPLQSLLRDADVAAETASLDDAPAKGDQDHVVQEQAQDQVVRTQQRLSTGLRINSAKDDAAGLSVPDDCQPVEQGHPDGDSELQDADQTLQSVLELFR